MSKRKRREVLSKEAKELMSLFRYQREMRSSRRSLIVIASALTPILATILSDTVAAIMMSLVVIVGVVVYAIYDINKEDCHPTIDVD